MLKPLVFAGAVLSIAATASAQGGPARLARCLHGDSESADQKARREKAIKVAQAINSGEVVGVGPQKPKFRLPGELTNIPPLPAGFKLQFNLDTAAYSFSIKDTTDACHYAIFSDQDKFVYEGTPLTAARLLPVTTR